MLYDKVYREDVLAEAYRGVRQHGGSAGVDGETCGDIEAYGRERWLGELAQALREKTYRPQAVRRVWIPKSGGQRRPLGIPTVRDRVVQTAAVLVLEPIFEADLCDEQYGYRPKRSAHAAVRRVHGLLNTGHTDVVDADLADYFGRIPHAELMKSVARRISDRHMLHLIKMWLEVAVEEDDGGGGRRRTAEAKRTKRGIAQGSPISPLLSNLYVRRLLLGWKAWGLEKRLEAHMVNYADDLVICCRGTAEPAARALRTLVERLKLEVNEAKTQVCRVPAEPFDFLGYTFGRCYRAQTGEAYVGTRPSRKSIRRVCRAVSERTARRMLLKDSAQVVAELNRQLAGWANYFCLGSVSKAYRGVDAHARTRLRQWLCAKHSQSGKGTARYPDEYLYEHLGLTRLTVRTRDLAWAKA
jgi:group II intron reverse transcriptase/maturase